MTIIRRSQSNNNTQSPADKIENILFSQYKDWLWLANKTKIDYSWMIAYALEKVDASKTQKQKIARVLNTPYEEIFD